MAKYSHQQQAIITIKKKKGRRTKLKRPKHSFFFR